MRKCVNCIANSKLHKAAITNGTKKSTWQPSVSVVIQKIHMAAVSVGCHTKKPHDSNQCWLSYKKNYMTAVSVGCHTKNPHGNRQCRLSYKKSTWQPSVSVVLQKIQMAAVSVGYHTKNAHGSSQSWLSYKESTWQPSVSVCYTKNPHSSRQCWYKESIWQMRNLPPAPCSKIYFSL